MRNRKLSGSIALLAFLVLAFQGFTGCLGGNQVAFTSGATATAPADSGAALQGGADGHPFEGKPKDGTYYRNVPGYQCGGVDMIYSRIEVSNALATVHTVAQEDCQEHVLPVDLSTLGSSTLSSDFLGFAGGIYQAFSQRPTPAQPSQSPEVLCRLRSRADVALDILVTQNIANAAYAATVLGAVRVSGANSNLWSTLAPVNESVTRASEAPQISYSSADLTVQIARTPIAPGQVSKGHVRLAYAGIPVDDDVDCETGGLLDHAKPLNIIYPLSPNVLTASIGQTFNVNIHMTVLPVGIAGYGFCVGFVDVNGNRYADPTDCSWPPLLSESGSGDENPSVALIAPSGTPPGTYSVVFTYTRWTGTDFDNLPLSPQPGVLPATFTTGVNEYVIGTVTLQ